MINARVVAWPMVMWTGQCGVLRKKPDLVLPTFVSAGGPPSP